MAWDNLYRPRVLQNKKSANEVGANFAPTHFLPTTLSIARFIKGMLEYTLEESFFEGTQAEIEDAVNVLRLQVAEPLKTQEEVCGAESYGADFRMFTEELLQSIQGEGLPPPPWEFRVVPQPDGSVMLQFRTMEG